MRVPEPLRLVMDRSSKAPWLAMVHLWHHLGVPGLIGVSGELHRDWLRAAGGRVPVQVFDGIFSLSSFIKPDKGHASRQTWAANQSKESQDERLRRSPDHLTVALTWCLVHQHSGVDDASVASEHVLELRLTQRPRQTADVQISIFDHVWTRPCVRHLQEATGSVSVHRLHHHKDLKSNNHWTK